MTGETPGRRTLAGSGGSRFDQQMATQANVSRRAQRAIRKQRQRGRTAVAAIAVLAAVVAVVAVVLLAGGSDDDTAEIEVELFEFGFGGDLTASAGPIRLAATNTGRIDHNIGIRGGPISNQIGPGARLELDLGELAPGTYELYCDIVGHADAGMTAALVISEPDPATQP